MADSFGPNEEVNFTKEMGMKRLVSLSLAAMFLSGVMMVGNAQALDFSSSPNKLLMDGYSHLSATDDKLWGVFKVDSLKTWDPVANSFGPTYWNEGDNGDYLSIKFGGLDVDIASGAATSGLGYFTGGWAELWYNDGNGIDPFLADAAAGPGADYNAGDFALSMAAGTKLVDFEFAEDAILAHENAVVPGGAFAWTTPEHTFRINALTGDPSTIGYLNVTGGVDGALFDSNFFFNQFDIFLEGSNQGASYAGWNYQANSYSALSSTVPEPGTMLLLGAGLLGLAGCAGMRRRNMA